MDQALLLDFNINRPFQYYETFRGLLKKMDIELNSLSAADVKQGLPAVIEEKFDECSFLVLRKPFAVLSGEQMRAKVQEAVSSRRVNLLVLFSFSEMDALKLLNEFLSPYGMASSEFMVSDEGSNYLDTKKVVVFKPEAFRYDALFEGVGSVVIPQPHHLYLEEPAVPVLVGNPTTIANKFQERPSEQIDGEAVVVSALNETNGKVLLMDSTVFTNEWVDKNLVFLKNVCKWMTR